MNERLIVKSFGPVKDMDITFRKITILIGDQGTGKSCVAKLFSTFMWLEKDLVMKRRKVDYYEKGEIFRTRLCFYHRVDSFLKPETYIRFEGTAYSFEYSGGRLRITETGKDIESLPKIMYVPAERSVLSVAENRAKLIKELPDPCLTFNDEFVDSKSSFRAGYELPFGNLHYRYDSLNGVSNIWGDGYEEAPVHLSKASSGIQSALPLCLVSEYLSRMVAEGDGVKLSVSEIRRMEREVEAIMSNKDYSESVKEIMLKRLSVTSRYGRFINIAEEPELNLFPGSQMDVLCSLVRNNASSPGNMLLLTTHSPYTLAIFNMMIMAGKVMAGVDDGMSGEATETVAAGCPICPDDIAAFCLTGTDGDAYCQSIISDTTGLISKNALDMVSEEIMTRFNDLYRLYAKTVR
ncbi:MAG: ATP-binding protein [Prevotella sp.]|nr:ATP-binding protein [Prevotella sp.]